MASPQVNGETPSSVFIQHLLGYPVVYDGVTTFKQNPYGAKSIEISDSAYKALAQPVLSYFSKQLEYVSPYIKRADTIGDQTLSKVDEKFPVVKKPTGEIYSDAKSLMMYPYRKGIEGRDHVFSTYNTECKKAGGGNIVTYSKAALTTALLLTTETLTAFTSYLNTKKEEAKEVVNERANN